MYVYCVVCYCVIVAPYVRSVVMSFHIVTHLIMIWNADWTMRSLYSLSFFSIINEYSLILMMVIDEIHRFVKSWIYHQDQSH